MSFNRLQIRYQTARSLPAPYAYFYTLTAQPVAPDAIRIDLAITYPDRDDIDDDELLAEGFTRDDDFSWSGQLPKAWLEAATTLIAKTRLQPLDEDGLDEDDDFWNITVEAGGASKQGNPTSADGWHYLVQELMQAAYESTGRERPFELTYLNLGSQPGDKELRLTASFAERTVEVLSIQSGQESTQTLPWATLRRIMHKVYEHDFDPGEAQFNRPKGDGHWLNLGGEEWYNVGDLPALIKLLGEL